MRPHHRNNNSGTSRSSSRNSLAEHQNGTSNGCAAAVAEEDAEIVQWARALRLSREIRNPAKDFSDASLVAEIVAHFLPRYVLALSSFPAVQSTQLKRYNWETLDKVVLRHLGLRLSATAIGRLAGAEPGAIQTFLPLLRDKIDDALAQRRFRPSSARSRSTSRGGSQLHLDRILRGEEERTPNGGMPMLSGEETAVGRPPKVLDELDKDQLVERLYAKVRSQEAQLRKKDEQIEALTRKVDKLLEIVCENKNAQRNRNSINGSQQLLSDFD